MSINIWTDSMQHAALLGKPVLFTNWLIQRDIIPDGWYCYDLRGTHKSPSTRTTLVDHAAVYHAGTVLSPIPLKHEGTASRRVNGTFYLLGEEMTLEQFCEEHDLAYPQDNREFVLRPASLDEVGLFYSEEKLDEALGTVGHLRMDFGHGEKEFWHTWWPHNEDILHLMRGQVFDFGGLTWFTMGGAASHDIQDGVLDPAAPDFEHRYWLMRRMRSMFRVKGVSWWAEEMPSQAEYQEALANLERVNWTVDCVLTHCAPSGAVRKLNPSYGTDELTDFLEAISQRCQFAYWFFGHYHENRIIDQKYILQWEKISELSF